MYIVYIVWIHTYTNICAKKNSPFTLLEWRLSRARVLYQQSGSLRICAVPITAPLMHVPWEHAWDVLRDLLEPLLVSRLVLDQWQNSTLPPLLNHKRQHTHSFRLISRIKQVYIKKSKVCERPTNSTVESPLWCELTWVDRPLSSKHTPASTYYTTYLLHKNVTIIKLLVSVKANAWIKVVSYLKLNCRMRLVMGLLDTTNITAISTAVILQKNQALQKCK